MSLESYAVCPFDIRSGSMVLPAF